MTIRNLPDDIHNELKLRATQNRRSVEAEVRSLITSAVVSGAGGGAGDKLRERFSEVTGAELSNLRSEIRSQTETDQ